MSARLAFMVVSLAVVAAVGGCQRRTDVVVIPPDSTRAAVADSATEEVRQAQAQWENGGSEAAASATARLIAHRLRDTPPTSWHDHAGQLLDSLSIGAEFADASCAMVVNFFPRSDPEAGSWPYLFWCSAHGPSFQAVEGKNLHLMGAISRGLHETPSAADSVRMIAAVLQRRAAGGLQPLVMSWLQPRPSGSWKLVQALGADSLGFGTAEFEAPSDTGAMLSARTYRPPRGFVECATCPHVYSTLRFHWTTAGFVRLDTQRVPSPYASFVDFIAALVAGDHTHAADRVADPSLVAAAEQLQWNVPKGAWRPAPGADESPSEMTFFRGSKEAYKVHFRSQSGDWIITAFEPVTRSVE